MLIHLSPSHHSFFTLIRNSHPPHTSLKLLIHISLSYCSFFTLICNCHPPHLDMPSTSHDYIAHPSALYCSFLTLNHTCHPSYMSPELSSTSSSSGIHLTLLIDLGHSHRSFLHPHPHLSATSSRTVNHLISTSHASHKLLIHLCHSHLVFHPHLHWSSASSIPLHSTGSAPASPTSTSSRRVPSAPPSASPQTAARTLRRMSSTLSRTPCSSSHPG